MSTLTILPAKYSDMDFLTSQANKEGWNLGLYDTHCFFETDPHGFFIGYLKDKKVGCISAVKYNDSYGFLGFYIVLSDYRGRGLGMQLWNHALADFGERTIGLDGVAAQQANYGKSGFHYAYGNIRFSREGEVHPVHNLTPLKETSLSKVLSYDKSIYGLDRSPFLQRWFRMPNIYSLGKFAEGHLLGYGCIRKCKTGYKIGPLFADSAEIAEEIYLGLCHYTDGQEVFLDVPNKNKNALEITQKYKMKPVFETARMYKSIPLNQDLGKVYGVTTFELG